MMRVTPRRLTILQCSQRTFTDGLTFIARVSPSSLYRVSHSSLYRPRSVERQLMPPQPSREEVPEEGQSPLRVT